MELNAPNTMHCVGCNPSIPYSKRFTSKTHCVVPGVRGVGVQIDGHHSDQPSSTQRIGDVYGVAERVVSQPARATHIHAFLPCQVQLSSRGQTAAQFGTLLSRFIEGDVRIFRVEDPAWGGFGTLD